MPRLLVALLAVTLALASGAAGVAPQSAWDHVARIVVMGDLHGDYAKFHDQLLLAGLIDGRDNWTGGATHLVQVGDVPDRAPDTRRILDLLIRLEPQARRAGGYVHALIGDHEAMNMEGDLRYTTPGEFAAFADRDSARRRDAYRTLLIAALKAHPPPEGVPKFDAAWQARFEAEHPLGWVEHQAAWSPDGVYGRWILTHSAVIRIGDAIYLHGGLGPEFLPYDIDAMDKAVVTALRHQPEVAGGPHDILWNEQGPLWYRGMAQHEEATEAAQVAAVLAQHKVSHIVVGHTKQYSTVWSRFGGGVILTDIAVRGGCPDPHAFLIREGDRLTVVYRGRRLAFALTGPGRADYLAQVAALDRAAMPDPNLAAKCLAGLFPSAP